MTDFPECDLTISQRAALVTKWILVDKAILSSGQIGIKLGISTIGARKMMLKISAVVPEITGRMYPSGYYWLRDDLDPSDFEVF